MILQSQQLPSSTHSVAALVVQIWSDTIFFSIFPTLKFYLFSPDMGTVLYIKQITAVTWTYVIVVQAMLLQCVTYNLTSTFGIYELVEYATLIKLAEIEIYL